MFLNQLANKIYSSEHFADFYNKLNNGNDVTMAVSGSVRPIMVACQYAINPRPTVVVVPGNKNAEMFARELRVYLGYDNVFEYFAPVEDVFDATASASRNHALYNLCGNKNCIVVVPARDMMRKLPDRAHNFCKPLKLFCGEEYEFDNILSDLVKLGYRQYEALEGPGTFIVKGGIIDVFPGNLSYPIRLDFFGDQLDEIRRIVLATGQTTNSLNEAIIFPVCDIQLEEFDINRAKLNLESRARTNKQVREYLEKIEQKISFNEIYHLEPYIFKKMLPLSSFLPDKSLCIVSEPRAIFDDCSHHYQELADRYKNTSFSLNSIYLEPKNIEFGKSQCLNMISIMQTGIQPDVKLKVKRPVNHTSIEHLANICKDYYSSKFDTVLSVPNTRARNDVKMELVEYGASINEAKYRLDDSELLSGVVNVTDMPIGLSFVMPEVKIAFLSLTNSPIVSQNIMKQNSNAYKTSFDDEQENQGRISVVTNISTKYLDITKITFPYRPGDYVVHSYHGIAKFVDLVRRDLAGSERDYLLLEYAEGDKLYVPVEQLGRITRYVGPQGRKPRVTRLGTADWSRAMHKARKATKKMAFDLVDVYSRRETALGHAFAKDSDRQKQMENDFPYTETFDQMKAIDDVKADMESARPMDRLICGDVGFGKTEVALRAAFKCVDEGMQVMVLCPTTILASQHFNTFYNRLHPYGVSVDVLSRFKTTAETNDIVDRFADGQLQVLIGTHRLLSRDINPKSLGLVIIDEEQRFGVGHKEQFKNFRESIDVLTLSATPIPRTMQMATSGVRDMSLILTPPDDRLPVEVHVGEWDQDLVSDAIRREVGRGGQVYYVSNRVKTIKDAVARVGIAAGEVRIGVAHGQMQKSQLEYVMNQFSNGQIDVLISTTIIESGLDNPKTNTLIVEDSQNLGLAQMYQLKGRVGRSVEQAYAYFMFNDKSILNENATARLTAIDELSDLGSGVQIALRDLEIRGAGNFLGAEQSGNLSGVGFDLFAQMLKGAVENAQNYDATNRDSDEEHGYLAPSISDVAINIPGSAYFPDDYIQDVDQRVIWYRRLACAQSLDEVFAIESELLEYNDAIPQIAQNLILKSRIAGLAMKYGMKLVSVSGGKLILEGRELNHKQIQDLRLMAGKYFPLKCQISLPIHRITSGPDANLFYEIYEFLDGLEFN